jgi:hypothetical protein
MLIRKNDLIRLIRHSLLESCITPSQRNPETDEQEIIRIWERLRSEFLDLVDDNLSKFLERTTLHIVKGREETPDLYDRATKAKADGDAIFAARVIKNPNWLFDIIRRKAAHEAGNHNVIYYHMYGVDDRFNCLDSDIVESKLRHELEHFVSMMSAFEGAGSKEGHELGHTTLSEYQVDIIDDLLEEDFWSNGDVPQSMPSLFQHRWNELDAGQDVGGSASDTWDEIASQWTDYEEARALLMQAKRYADLSDIGSMTLMDVQQDEPGGFIDRVHLKQVVLMLKKNCRGSQSCRDSWNDLQ